MWTKVALLDPGARHLQVFWTLREDAAGIGDLYINLHGAQPLDVIS